MKSQDSFLLGIEDAPEGWRVGNYQDDNVIDSRGLHEYMDDANGRFRVAVFHNFLGDKGWGVYAFIPGPDYSRNWTLFGDLGNSHEQAVHLMICYAKLGAFDAYL